MSGLPFIVMFLTLIHTHIHTPVHRGRDAHIGLVLNTHCDTLFSADRTNACTIVIKAAVTGFSSEASPPARSAVALSRFSNFSALSRSYITGGSMVLQENMGDLKGT